MPVMHYETTGPKEIGPNTFRRIIHTGNIMSAVIDFKNGPMTQPDPPHTHPHEQTTYVAKGEVYFFIGEEKFHLHEGDAVAVPSGVPHTIQTLSDHVRLVDTFTPLREDFLGK